MSLGRRIEFLKTVRDLATRLEFHQAGDSTADRLAAAEVTAEIDAAYLRWGVGAIEGLSIDGAPADVDALINAAPEAFVREVVERIKLECGVTADEAKN